MIDQHVYVVVLEQSAAPLDPFCHTTVTSIVGVYGNQHSAQRRTEAIAADYEANPYLSVTIEDRIVL